MIASISLGKSFAHCIGYCLEDKRTLTKEQKLSKALQDGLQRKERAEVLAYNKCFGDKHELAEQFIDVRRLSKRVEKPVLHLSLRLAPGETLNRQQWITVGQEIAKEMGVADNQYLIVQHKDTPEQHIHLVANRVGYDGRAASTSNNYIKLDRLCRRLEKQYRLTEVLSPRQFLPKEMRSIPRHDCRKEKMKSDIQQTLKIAKHYQDFEQRIRKLGYCIIKGRGIIFIDERKVKVKGSELGFSLSTIEKNLHLKQQKIKPQQEKITRPERITETEIKKHEQQQLPIQWKFPKRLQPTPVTTQRMMQQVTQDAKPERAPIKQIEKGWSGMLRDLMKPEYVDQSVSPELLHEARKKKKRKRPRI